MVDSDFTDDGEEVYICEVCNQKHPSYEDAMKCEEHCQKKYGG